MPFARAARGSKLMLGALALSACAHADPRVYPLKSPVLRDQDLEPVRVECRRDEGELACLPEEYKSSFVWDAVDNAVFRPTSDFFKVPHYGEADNVNAFDEAPDSSWFTNRIGARDMSPHEASLGSCPDGPELKSDPPAGSWVIDHGKDNGAKPGFRISANGTNYMIKTDDGQGERGSAATAIASRFYHAAGFWSPCDSIVYFKRAALRLLPGLKIIDNQLMATPFDEPALTRMLSKAARRGDLIRANASRWLPGQPIGPFTYEGRRGDDPSDIIPHENRRDLRGARLLAAWLDHWDSREQNTMSTWHPVNPDDPRSAGHVRHWYIDFGDCFGAAWRTDGYGKRHGHGYVVDFAFILEDFASFGVIARPWDRAEKTSYAPIFDYFTARDFDAEAWRGAYPNPAFGRMTERDAAWAARIISRFTPAHVEAIVKAGDFTNAVNTQFLKTTLLARQRILLTRYFKNLSSLSDVRTRDRLLCATDLALRSGTYPLRDFGFSALVSRAGSAERTHPVRARADGTVCVALTDPPPGASVADAAPERYVVVRLNNRASKGPLVVHLYDLGKRGLRVVGIDRPSS